MGSDLSDFIAQIPIGPIIMFCGSGILIVIAMVGIIQGRARKERAARQAQVPSFVGDAEPVDLPELDMLAPVTAEKPRSDVLPISPTRTTRKGMYTVNLNDGSSAEAVEVLTVLRDVVDGGLIVQMGDRAYRSVAHDEALKNSFLKVMRELSFIVKTTPMESPETEEAIQPEPEPEEPTPLRDLVTPPAEAKTLAAEPDKPKVSPVPPPPTTPEGAMPGDLPRFSLDERPAAPKRGGLLRRGKLELEPVPELNIAGAIEAYLQHKLKYTSDYSGRSIHVHPAPGGGVSIEVDGRFFDAVNDVDDPTVRTFLQETIQEWQQRH